MRVDIIHQPSPMSTSLVCILPQVTYCLHNLLKKSLMETRKVKLTRKHYFSRNRMKTAAVRRRGESESTNDPGEEGERAATTPQVPTVSQPQSGLDLACLLVTASPSLDCAADIVGAVEGEDESVGGSDGSGGSGGTCSSSEFSGS